MAASRTLELILTLRDESSKQLQGLQQSIANISQSLNQSVNQAAQQSINQSVQAQKGAVESAKQQIKGVAEESDNFFVKLFKSVQGFSGQIQGIGFSFFGIQYAVQQFAQITKSDFDLLLGNSIELQNQLIQIQSTLAATTSIKVAGDIVTEPLAKINAFRDGVINAIDTIREKSLEISNVTSDQLIGVFKLVSNSTGVIGANLQQATDLTVAFSSAMTALQIPLYQARQEVTSILQGTIDQNSALAKALNINNAIIQQEKSKGTLVQYLLERTAALGAGQALLAKTFSGVTSNIAEIFERVRESAGKPLLQPLTDQLNKFYDLLAANRKGLENFFSGVSSVVLDIAGKFADVQKSLEPINATIAQIAVTIASAFGGTVSQSLIVFLAAAQAIGTVLSTILAPVLAVLNSDFSKFVVTLTTIAVTLNSLVIPAFLELGAKVINGVLVGLAGLAQGVISLATVGFPSLTASTAITTTAFNGLTAAYLAFEASANGQALITLGNVVISLANAIRTQLATALTSLAISGALQFGQAFEGAGAILLRMASAIGVTATATTGLATTTALATVASGSQSKALALQSTALAVVTTATETATAATSTLALVLGGAVVILGALAVAFGAYIVYSEIVNENTRTAKTVTNEYAAEANALIQTIDKLTLKRKENGQLSESESALLKQTQEETARTSSEIQINIEYLEKQKNEFGQNKEELDKLIASQKELLKQLQSIEVLALPVQRLGTAYEQFETKLRGALDVLKSGGGDPVLFQKYAQTITQVTKEQFDLGQLTSDQAQKRLTDIVNNANVEVETQRKAQSAITAIIDEETKRRANKNKAELSEAEIGLGDKKITQVKQEQLLIQEENIRAHNRTEIKELADQAQAIYDKNVKEAEKLQKELELIQSLGAKTLREKKLADLNAELKLKEENDKQLKEQAQKEIDELTDSKYTGAQLRQLEVRQKAEQEQRNTDLQNLKNKLAAENKLKGQTNEEAIADNTNAQNALREKQNKANEAAQGATAKVEEDTQNKLTQIKVDSQKLVTEDLDRQLKIRKDLQETAIKDVEVAVKLGQKTELEGIEAISLARRQQLIDELAITQRKYEQTTNKDDAYAQGLLQKSKQLQDQITELTLKTENDRVAAKIRVLDRANQETLNKVKQNEQEQQTEILLLKTKGYKSDLDLARRTLENKKEIIKEEIEAQRKVVEAKSAIFDKDPGRDEATRAQRQNELAQEKLKLGALGNQIIETQTGLEKNLLDIQARGVELQVKGLERQQQLAKSNFELLQAQQELAKSVNTSQTSLANLRLDQIKEASELTAKYQAGEFQNSQQRALVEQRISELGFSTGSQAIDFARQQFAEKQKLLALERQGFEAQQAADRASLQAKQLERSLQFQITEDNAKIALINAGKNEEARKLAQEVLALIGQQRGNLDQINQLENQSLDTQQKSARTLFDAKESSEKFKDAMGIAGAEAANLGQATNGVTNGLNAATNAAGQLTSQTQKAAQAMQDYGKGIDEATKKQIALANTANQVGAGNADQTSIDILTKGSTQVSLGQRKVTNAEIFAAGQSKDLSPEQRSQNALLAEETRIKDREALETAKQKLEELRAQTNEGLSQLEIDKKALEIKKQSIALDQAQKQVGEDTFLPAKRLRGFASGGVPFKGEIAAVGEQGQELIKFGNGKSTVVGNGGTEIVKFGNVGAKVFNATQTREMLRGSAPIGKNEVYPNQSDELVTEIRGLRGDMRKGNKPVNNTFNYAIDGDSAAKVTRTALMTTARGGL